MTDWGLPRSGEDGPGAELRPARPARRDAPQPPEVPDDATIAGVQRQLGRLEALVAGQGTRLDAALTRIDAVMEAESRRTAAELANSVGRLETVLMDQLRMIGSELKGIRSDISAISDQQVESVHAVGDLAAALDDRLEALIREVEAWRRRVAVRANTAATGRAQGEAESPRRRSRKGDR